MAWSRTTSSDRRKQGFSAPVKEWFRDELADYARRAILDSRLRERDFFDYGALAGMLEAHRTGRRNYDTLLWSLVNLSQWYDHWIAGGAGAGAGGGMIRVCVVAPKYMTGGQAIEARTLVDGFAGSDDVRVELQPIDPRIPAWIARIKGRPHPGPHAPLLGRTHRRVGRADVVHVFTAAFWPFLLTTTPAVLVARAMGRPVVLNYRDGRAPTTSAGAGCGGCCVGPPSWCSRQASSGTCSVSTATRARWCTTWWIRTGSGSADGNPSGPCSSSCRLLEELYAVENTLLAFDKVRASAARRPAPGHRGWRPPARSGGAGPGPGHRGGGVPRGRAPS